MEKEKSKKKTKDGRKKVKSTRWRIAGKRILALLLLIRSRRDWATFQLLSALSQARGMERTLETRRGNSRTKKILLGSAR